MSTQFRSGRWTPVGGKFVMSNCAFGTARQVSWNRWLASFNCELSVSEGMHETENVWVRGRRPGVWMIIPADTGTRARVYRPLGQNTVETVFPLHPLFHFWSSVEQSLYCVLWLLLGEDSLSTYMYSVYTDPETPFGFANFHADFSLKFRVILVVQVVQWHLPSTKVDPLDDADMLLFIFL